MAFSMAMPWHEGEEKMHRLLHLPPQDNPTAAMLTPQATFMFQQAPLLAIGTLDAQNRPWITLWGGEPGFSEPLGGGMIGTRALVDGSHDPVVQALVGGSEKEEKAEAKSGNGKGKMIAGLAIDLMTRKRVKVAGRMLAGTLQHLGDDTNDAETLQQSRIQLVTLIEQSLGNCPKYLNQYTIKPAPIIASECVSATSSSALSDEAKALIATSDMFFLSTRTPSDMDVNHRGGPPGFVRIESVTTLLYPEYSGNRLYQSLGNLLLNPQIGVCFPSYTTGDVLYITGEAEILAGKEEAGTVLPGSNLAVRIRIHEARYVRCGLGFRGAKHAPSPYNPRLRPLASEGNIRAALATDNGASTRQIAVLIKKEVLTPTIARFTFSVKEKGGIAYVAGQWIALDFSDELDVGYEHMRDEDPASLNDDFVRTFTISSDPPAFFPSSSSQPNSSTFTLTIRKLGPVTSFLFRQSPSSRSNLSIPIVGIGGGDIPVTQNPSNKSKISFIAAGVGITPLLPHLAHLDLSPTRFTLYWTLRGEDFGLVRDTFAQYPRLVACTRLFLTGMEGSEAVERMKEGVGEVAGLEMGRLRESDLELDLEARGGKGGERQAETWWVCVGSGMRKEVVRWLEEKGKKVLFEDFGY